MSEHHCPTGRHPEPSYTCRKLCPCRCDGCTEERSKYDRWVTKQKAYGRWEPYIDAEPVRTHLQWLRDRGMGLRHLSRVVGISRSSLARILQDSGGIPQRRRVRPETAERILAVYPTLDDYADGVRLPADETRRMMRELKGLGWTFRGLSEATGLSRKALWGATVQESVTARTARIIRDLHRDRPVPPQWAQAQPSAIDMSRNGVHPNARKQEH